MPIPPPAVNAPFSTVDDVLNLVRSKMNDAIGSLAGDILTDQQPFMQELSNSGWRELQFFLATLGYSPFTVPFLGQAYPAVDSTDPVTWTTLSWTQFVNASGAIFAPPTIDVLPQNMIMPLWVEERITNSNSRTCKMEMAQDRLPQTRKGPYNGWWKWENQVLRMPGSIYSMDLLMELAVYLPDFNTTGAPPTQVFWYQQPVPLVRAKNALALFICDEVIKVREDMSGTFRTQAETAAKQLYNLEVSQKQRTPSQRRPYGAGWASGYGGQGYGTGVW